MANMDEEKPKRDRSPVFPFIGLRKAIKRAEEFAEQFKRHPARIGNAAAVWGLAPKSGIAFQTIGALKGYGLMDDIGSGEGRKVQLSDLAWRYLQTHQQEIRDQAIAEAALKPKLIAEYWDKWGSDGRPPDAECLDELFLERGFTKDAARRFLRIYDDSIALAKLQDYDSLSGHDEDKQTEGTGQSHDTGLTLGAKAGMTAEATVEREFLHGPLSRDSRFRLLMTGEVGPEEIGKLIRVLTLQKELLDEDEPPKEEIN